MNNTNLKLCLENKFNGIWLDQASEFYSEPDINGLWFKNGDDYLCRDGLPIFDEWIHYETEGLHPELHKILSKYNWYAEPYDGATLLIYPM